MLTRFSLAPLFSWNSDPLINISPQAQGTASQLPYDVLRVIFFHCLPPYPLDDLQPNTKIAPILLCHACSSWRMAALSVPELWSHLRFNFRISDVIVEDRAFESNFILAPRNHWQNEFLSWWRNNQGYKPTFTHFGPAWVGLGGRSDDVSVTKMDILNDYLTSAQYLKLEYPFFTLMAQMFRSKGELKVPNLNTLVKSGWNEFDSETLFLSSNMSTSWLDSRAINELYTVLASTPSITTLSLGERFLSFASPDSNWKLVGHISPIWSHVPHLNHLEQDSTKSTT